MLVLGGTAGHKMKLTISGDYIMRFEYYIIAIPIITFILTGPAPSEFSKSSSFNKAQSIS